MYGTATGVGALARVWTQNGVFVDPDVYDNGTNPSLEQVTTWLVALSSSADVALANEGFEVPVVQETALASIATIVESLVADLCHAANSTGRFFTERAIERGVSPMYAVRKELSDWVTNNANGLENLGVPRRKSGQHLAGFDMM